MLNEHIKDLSEKLEIINLQFAWRNAVRRAALHWLLIALCGGILAVAAVLAAVGSPYLRWDYSAPETAVMGVAIHAFGMGLCPSGALRWHFSDTEKSIGYVFGVCTTEQEDKYHRTNMSTENRAKSVPFRYAESRRTV